MVPPPSISVIAPWASGRRRGVIGGGCDIFNYLASGGFADALTWSQYPPRRASSLKRNHAIVPDPL